MPNFATTLDEKTHVRLTLGLLVVCSISLISFVWNAAGWAAEIEQTQKVANETANTVSELAKIVESQVATQTAQQRQLDRILDNQEAVQEQATEIREELIRVRTQLEERDDH